MLKVYLLQFLGQGFIQEASAAYRTGVVYLMVFTDMVYKNHLVDVQFAAFSTAVDLCREIEHDGLARIIYQIVGKLQVLTYPFVIITHIGNRALCQACRHIYSFLVEYITVIQIRRYSCGTVFRQQYGFTAVIPIYLQPCTQRLGCLIGLAHGRFGIVYNRAKGIFPEVIIIISLNMFRAHLLQSVGQNILGKFYGFGRFRLGIARFRQYQNHLVHIELGAFRSAVDFDGNIEIHGLALICGSNLGNLFVGGDPLAAMIHTNIGFILTQIRRDFPCEFIEVVLTVNRNCASRYIHQPLFTAVVITVGCGHPVTHCHTLNVVCLTQGRICILYQNGTHICRVSKIGSVELLNMLGIYIPQLFRQGIDIQFLSFYIPARNYRQR